MVDRERTVSQDEQRIELSIRDILTQLDIPQEKWPTELINPIPMNY
ncbi:hypothetical protein [Paenibacillus sp. NEAU-GSW1]|nr:hypothetical protein [Paenibacillus sp. NEAU-GSW1]MUT67652.1 hypothetical protein [Paenibacillus sp. NEAU-GSW1]